jgi:DNA modification methylase
MKQYPLFEISEEKETRQRKEWGTFKDSLRAPIHNWFTYPAGFSYKAVEASLAAHNITEGQVVYDPFMGSGTTNLAAKKLGISSYGVEAHPFVFRIARTKLNWELNQDGKIVSVDESLQKIGDNYIAEYTPQFLKALYSIVPWLRNPIEQLLQDLP